MTIKGLEKFTLLDYPGKLACTVFLPGCNFRCPWCYSPELVIPTLIDKQPELSVEELLSFLEKRKGLLDAVTICGGEPTLQEGLFDIMRKIKEKGFLLKIDTNGSRPSVLRGLMEESLLDYVAMDVKLPLRRYGEITKEDPERIMESIDLLRDSGIDHEFRTTVVPGIHCGEDIREIARTISGSERYYLQNFLPEKTLDDSFLRKDPFSDKEMEDLKREADPFVKMCRIR